MQGRGIVIGLQSVRQGIAGRPRHTGPVPVLMVRSLLHAIDFELVAVDARSGGGSAQLRLAGELDICTAPRLRAAVRHMRLWEAGCIDVDLTGLSFIDCVGARALVHAVKEMEDAGGCVSVEAGPVAGRVLRLTGFHAELPMRS